MNLKPVTIEPMLSCRLRIWSVLIGLVLFTGCTRSATSNGLPASAAQPVENSIQSIPLGGPAAARKAELSGLAWCADQLILLPQYPERFEGGPDGALFSLPKTALLNAIDQPASPALEPSPVALDTQGLLTELKGFEGFESITIAEREAYLTIEARVNRIMRTYLVKGQFNADCSQLRLDPDPYAEIPAQANIPNFSDESILLFGERIFSLYEANGKAVNPQPIVHSFDQDLTPVAPLSLANLEYRLSDASEVDAAGKFWVINLYFVVEPELYSDFDPLSALTAAAQPANRFKSIERLVELQFSEDGVVPSGTAPIPLNPGASPLPHNWEGLARLDERGFLIVTDKYFKTTLAFVSFPQ